MTPESLTSVGNTLSAPAGVGRAVHVPPEMLTSGR